LNAENARRKTKTEFLRLDAKKSRRQKMPKLMGEDQN